MPRAILLDLDQTLDDRTQSIAGYAEHFCRDFTGGLAPIATSTVAKAILAADGNGYRRRAELFEDLLEILPWRSPPALAAIRAHWETWFPVCVAARDGLLETLAALRASGICLGLVSNGTLRMQEPKIAALGIRPYLSTVVISETLQIQKPDPRIFAHALAEVGCPAGQAWFVGDHPVYDVLGAATAGLRPIWIVGPHPWPSEHPEPQWRIASLGELVDLAQRERAFREGRP